VSPVFAWRALRIGPELGRHLQPDTEKLYGVFSENMRPGAVHQDGAEDRRGDPRRDGWIVIGHGTDTMHHTAAILSFMVQDSADTDRDGRLAEILGQAVFRCGVEPHQFGAHRAIGDTPKSWFACSVRRPTNTRFCTGERACGRCNRATLTFRTIGDVPLAMVRQQGRDHSPPARLQAQAQRPAGQGKHGLRGEGDDRLLLSEHASQHCPTPAWITVPGDRDRGTVSGNVNKPL